MNEPKISITVMPGAQMNGYVKEQHNYFAPVRQIVGGGEKKGEDEMARNESAAPDERQQDIISQLKPIFFGIEEDARNFLARIQGMKPTQITELVNQLVKEKKLSDQSCHRPLWKVLHEAGIYAPSESNWNMQVK